MKGAKYTNRGDWAMTMQPERSHYVSLAIKQTNKCGYSTKKSPHCESQNVVVCLAIVTV